MAGVKQLVGYSVAIVALAATVLTGIAVVGGFKTTLLIDNATADKFTAGLAIFGTFVGILALALVGKIVIGMFTNEGN